MNCHDIFSYTWHLNSCYLIFDASALHRICVFFMLVVILLLSYNGCHVWFFLGGVSREDGVFFAHVQKNGVYFFASFFVIYSRQKHSTCHLYFTIQIFIMFTGNFWVFFIFYVFFCLYVGFFGFFVFSVIFWFFCIFLIILFMFVLDWVEW